MVFAIVAGLVLAGGSLFIVNSQSGRWSALALLLAMAIVCGGTYAVVAGALMA